MMAVEPKDTSAVILAGGKSSRMGSDKLLLPLGRRPVIAHVIEIVRPLFAECVVVTDHTEKYSSFGVRVVSDILTDLEKNSLAGIHAGLCAAKSRYALVLAGDMPFVRPEVLTALCRLCDGYDAAVPREGPHLQPLCAVYHRGCLGVMEEMISLRKYKISEALARLRVNYVDGGSLLRLDPDGMSFFNINTPKDYELAKNYLSKKEKLR